MRKFFLLTVLAGLFCGSCSDDDSEIPADADDNFITSVVMTVNDGISYSAEIVDNTITMTVPYTVSLNNAQVVFEYTSSAMIVPNPASITDWDTERTFRVTSYNGVANDYTYRVIKDEIRHEGNVELKTTADVSAFVDTDVTVIKGDLIIGSDAEEAEDLPDIAALKILKEVEGNIIIQKSYTGQDFSGLDNITSVGGIQIGSKDIYAVNSNLHMISMKSLETVVNDIIIRNNQIVFTQFDKLSNVGGNIIVASASLQTFEFPSLVSVGADLDIQATTDEEKAGGEVAKLELPALTTVGGTLGVNNLEKLISINLPKLTEAGSINFKSIPIAFESLSLPELSVVNGNLHLEANYYANDAFTSTGNNKLLAIDGLSNLSIVKGILTISKFEALENLPDWSKLTQLGGLSLNRLLKYYNKELDLSNVEFVMFENTEPAITIYQTVLGKLITKENLSNVNMNISCSAVTGVPGPSLNTALNFKYINNLSIENSTGDEDPTYIFEQVYGNLEITRRAGQTTNGISAPYLANVNGYMYISINESTGLNLPNLESIGGQMLIEGSTAYENFKYDLSKLKDVCLGENPQYRKEETNSTGTCSGGLDIQVGNSFAYTLPALEHVGGKGLTLRGIGGFDAPKLHSIDGTLYIYNARNLTALGMPQLKKLQGVNFYRTTKFRDFSMFAPFILNGQITEANWSVKLGGYNPSYQDMIDKKYTQQ